MCTVGRFWNTRTAVEVHWTRRHDDTPSGGHGHDHREYTTSCMTASRIHVGADRNKSPRRKRDSSAVSGGDLCQTQGVASVRSKN